MNFQVIRKFPQGSKTIQLFFLNIGFELCIFEIVEFFIRISFQFRHPEVSLQGAEPH